MEINTNWRHIHYPSRIVCTTTESVDILYRLGLGEKIVGVSGFANEPPEARKKQKLAVIPALSWKRSRN